MKKKLLALALAAAMIVPMPVMASGSENPSQVQNNGDDPDPSTSGTPQQEEGGEGGETEPVVVIQSSKSPKKSSHKKVELTLTDVSIADAQENVAITSSSAVEGISTTVVTAATEEGKTIGEYLNNAVTEVPGLSDATPIGQGGNVLINGALSNLVFSVSKPVAAEVDSAKTQAEALGGKVLNVAKISTFASFDTATVNFYTQGVKAGQNIEVYQYVNGAWVELEVTEIREDHVVVNMESQGTLAFIEI